jgi:hypothetical protein
MKCATQTTVYAFATSAATTKTAYSVPVLNASPCLGTQDVILSSGENSTANTLDTNQTSLITTLQTDSSALKAWSGVGGSVPNTDVLAAQSIIFGVTFAALCVIWGLKRLMAIFRTPDHE